MDARSPSPIQAVCWLLIGSMGATATFGCELCAVYNASNARSEYTQGVVLSLSEQFTHFGTEQLDGHELIRDNPDRLDSSITHLAVGYNFSSRLGISLNLPFVDNSFRRTDLRYSLTAPPALFTEHGSEFNLGDAALIGRWTAFAHRTMEFDFTLNVLGGVKFPTGKTDRIDDEVRQSEIFQELLPPGTPHDPLSHSISSVHQHELSPGSGSFDGIFGATINARWKRWLFNGQFQYSLRTEGEDSFQYGDDLLISAGPGRYLLANESGSLSIQLVASYESIGHDKLLGRLSDRTGSTAWYLGPQINATWGSHLSANAGVDLPLDISVNGLQSVPDYRIHGGISYRF